ncbi:MAG: hypothetical protein HOC77_00440 [Chloroflexi bacterium]|jgi:hypothetical protein|nr:hypothetical protein [Chloroflexota bacterium]MBT4073959.1 hypothetical protein [Chloroflexota bacterium]MBT4513543.1 hypothetical protein [Chloroflexota bacterium]MBT5320260.1 hypothetical protein [Chloroflexota bacterium]MBT6680715.1 hypothetical protein [Chloroflexota bacterium]
MYSDITAAGSDVLSIAVDLQGPDLPRPFHDKAGAEFTTVVDAGTTVTRTFGVRAVPNGALIDENGILRYALYGGFEIRKPATKKLVSDFLLNGQIQLTEETPVKGAVDVASLDYFERGLELYGAGDLEGAATIWREGMKVEPDHWNMRKQLWAIEHPDRFYDGDVDYGWQKEQVDNGK